MNSAKSARSSTEVSVSEVGGHVVSRVEETVQGVDTLEVVHDTKGEGSLQPGGGVDPVRELRGEAPDLIHVSLTTITGEVLIGELGDPDGLAIGIVELLSEINAVLRSGGVAVEGNGMDGAVGAGLEELLVPVSTSLVVGASRGDESVTLVHERLEVLAPELSSRVGGHV